MILLLAKVGEQLTQGLESIGKPYFQIFFSMENKWAEDEGVVQEAQWRTSMNREGSVNKAE